MGKFRQFVTELSARHMSAFSFPDDNLRKYHWIFIKLGMCISIVEIWCGITNGQITSTLAESSAHHTIMAGYYLFFFLLQI